jgi:hypothetical protein
MSVGTNRPLTFIEPLAERGSLGLLLLQRRLIDNLQLNAQDAGAFSFLQVALGKNCGNRREVNWLLKAAAESREQSDLANACEEPTSVRMQALAYVNRHVASVVAAGVAAEAAFRATVTDHIEHLYDLRVRVKGVAGQAWTSFLETLHKNYGGQRLVYFNALGYPTEGIVEMTQACRESGVHWLIYATPQLALAASRLEQCAEIDAGATRLTTSAQWHSNFPALLHAGQKATATQAA